MKKRLDATKRILAIQAQVKRLAQWQMEDLNRQSRAAAAESDALIGAMNSDSIVQGLFVDVMAKRLRRVAEQMRALDDASEVQAARLRAETGREKHAAKIVASARQDHARDAENKSLADITDAAEARRAASLP